MNLRTFLLLLIVFIVGIAENTHSQIPASPISPAFTFAPPEPADIAKLFEFGGPVTLERNIATPEELTRSSEKKKGAPLASFSYSDPQRTSERITVTILAAGSFLGEKRAALMEWAEKQSGSPKTREQAMGKFEASDGLSSISFPWDSGREAKFMPLCCPVWIPATNCS